MREFLIGNRHYRTDGRKSDVSGRLLMVEYRNGLGFWKTVKNVSRREEVLNLMEVA